MFYVCTVFEDGSDCEKEKTCEVLSGLSQIIQDPIEAYYKAVSLWHEREEHDYTSCEYICDENWRQRLGMSSDDRERTDQLCRSIEFDPDRERYSPRAGKLPLLE